MTVKALKVQVLSLFRVRLGNMEFGISMEWNFHVVDSWDGDLLVCRKE